MGAVIANYPDQRFTLSEKQFQYAAPGRIKISAANQTPASYDAASLCHLTRVRNLLRIVMKATKFHPLPRSLRFDADP
jgi:hypothetical protein